MQAFIFHKPRHGTRMRLPMSGWSRLGVRKNLPAHSCCSPVASLGSCRSPGCPTVSSPGCSYLQLSCLGETFLLVSCIDITLDISKARAAFPPAQVHPCTARQQCHLGALPRIGKAAKIRLSVHFFALLQCHRFYATRRAFPNLNYLPCFLQLICHAALETLFTSKHLSQHPDCHLVSACITPICAILVSLRV